MVDKKSDIAKVAILPGVEMTPEAQAILNKQLNRRIVWSYKATKAALHILALLPALIALYFVFGFVSAGIDSPTGLLAAAALIVLPLAACWILWRLASRY